MMKMNDDDYGDAGDDDGMLALLVEPLGTEIAPGGLSAGSRVDLDAESDEDVFGSQQKRGSIAPTVQQPW